MTAAAVENMEHKKARAEEANLLLEGLDEVTQKALYIATKMVLAKRSRRYLLRLCVPDKERQFDDLESVHR